MNATLRLCLTACLLCGFVPSVAAAQSHRHRGLHARRHAAQAARPRQLGQRRFAPNYGSGYDPTPTCRYADGKPYDPDIIGGENHVGDGGPAVNLGGYNPCGT